MRTQKISSVLMFVYTDHFFFPLHAHIFLLGEVIEGQSTYVPHVLRKCGIRLEIPGFIVSPAFAFYGGGCNVFAFREMVSFI